MAARMMARTGTILQEDEGHLDVDAPRHHDGEDDHEGHAHRDTNEHAEGVLNARDVRRCG